MAKLTLTDLSTTLSNSAATTININNGILETALEKTLSRDGTSPNQMEADFDLNGNDVVNAESVFAQRLFLDGAEVVPSDLVNTGEFATNEQGAKADSALQPGAIGTTVQAYDAGLASIAGLVTSADKLPYSTGVDTWALATLTSAGRALIDDVDAAAQRTTLGLGTAAVVNVNTLQPLDSDLTAIAALTSAADKIPYATGIATWAMTDFTAFARTLLDDADAATARGTLNVFQALVGTTAYDPPSLADGAGVSQTVTVTGAALGDVAVASFSLSTQGITVTANVTAADTVTVRFQNETTGVIDLGSGTLKAVVFK